MSAPRKVEITEHTQKNWMDRTIEQLAPYRRAILGLGLALVVGVVAIMLLSRQNTQKQERAWDNYFTFEQVTPANEEAVRKAITDLGNTEAALMLRMKLAQFLQREGTQQLFSDKKAGTKKITEAKENFTAIATKAKNSLAIEEAMFGAAMCEDSLGNVKEAIAAYEQQLQKFPQGVGVYAKIATDNLELLKSGGAQEWYAAFNKADVSVKTIDPVPDFGRRPGSGLGSGFSPGSGLGPSSGLGLGSGFTPGSGLVPSSGFNPSLGPGPSLEGPGSLMPSLDPLGTGVPSSTFGLPDFKLPPNPAGTEIPATGTPAKDGTTAPEKPAADPATKTPDSPLPALDGKSPATTSPTPEPAKTEPAKTEPEKK